MAKFSKRARSRAFFVVLGIFAVVLLPLLGILPLGNRAATPDTFQEHQDLIAEVILSKNRAEVIGQSPTRGNPEAERVLFKFSDFQCSFCARASGDMKTLVESYGDNFLYVYKHLPLVQIHPEAVPAARASWAAQQQDQFWPYHDALFANQERLGDELYQEIASDLGLDMEQFDRDRTSSASREAVAADQALAQELRFNRTPSFVMNDLLIPGGTPLEAFERLVSPTQG